MASSPAAASPPRTAPAADDSHLRVSLTALAIQRADGAAEDDFKTWAEVTLLGSDGVPDGARWHCGEDANLARTSVTNGTDAAYNYARASKAVALTEADVTAVVASTLVVRGRGRCAAVLAQGLQAAAAAAPARARAQQQSKRPAPLTLCAPSHDAHTHHLSLPIPPRF